MTMVHRILGFAIIAGFVTILLTGLVTRLRGRDEAPTFFWGAQHYAENVLVVQSLLGIVFLLQGRRLVGDDLVFLHYFYGSLFPLIVVIGGRIAGLRREVRDYVGPTWGSFFALGLTLRALMTGLGIGD